MMNGRISRAGRSGALSYITAILNGGLVCIVDLSIRSASRTRELKLQSWEECQLLLSFISVIENQRLKINVYQSLEVLELECLSFVISDGLRLSGLPTDCPRTSPRPICNHRGSAIEDVINLCNPLAIHHDFLIHIGFSY